MREYKGNDMFEHIDADGMHVLDTFFVACNIEKESSRDRFFIFNEEDLPTSFPIIILAGRIEEQEALAYARRLEYMYKETSDEALKKELSFL